MDAVINTITLPQLAALLNPDPGQGVVAAGKALRYRALVLVHLFANRDQVFKDQWVYYQDRRLPFNRVFWPKVLWHLLWKCSGSRNSSQQCPSKIARTGHFRSPFAPYRGSVVLACCKSKLRCIPRLGLCPRSS